MNYNIIIKRGNYMKDITLLRCSHCGKIVEIVHGCGTQCPTICCGEPMKELTPNTTDAAVEKHVPVVKVEDNKVTVSVGSVEHPMTEAHYITLIVLETKNGTQFKQLTPSDKPEAVFYIGEGDEVVAAYDYCNLHGLWKA